MLSTSFAAGKCLRSGQFRAYPRFPDPYFYNEFSLLNKKRMRVNGRCPRSTSAILPRGSSDPKAALLPMRGGERRPTLQMESSNRLGAAGKEKGTGMSAQKIRTAVGRFVVIGSLVIAVIAGSVGMNAPSKASAMPDLTSCYTAFRLGQIWQSYGDLMWAY